MLWDACKCGLRLHKLTNSNLISAHGAVCVLMLDNMTAADCERIVDSLTDRLETTRLRRAGGNLVDNDAFRRECQTKINFSV